MGRDADLSPLLVPRSKNRVELYLYSPKGSTWPIKRVKPNYICVFTLKLGSQLAVPLQKHFYLLTTHKLPPDTELQKVRL
jgi:hypothetical protein